MTAVLINVVTVLLGSVMGLLFGSRIKESYSQEIMMGIALCTFVIGVQSAIQTSNILIVMVCMVIGTVIGVALKLDDRMNGASDRIKERLKGTRFGKGPFAEAFMTTTMLFCIGTRYFCQMMEILNNNITYPGKSLKISALSYAEYLLFSTVKQGFRVRSTITNAGDYLICYIHQ